MGRKLRLQDISGFLDDDTYQQILDIVGSDEAEEIDNLREYLSANTAAGAYDNTFATKVIDPITSELIFNRGDIISPSALKKLAKAGIEKLIYNKPKPFEYDVKGDGDDFEDQLHDYILNHFSGDLPEDDSDESWERFYAEGSPFSTYYNEMKKKYPKPSEYDVNGDGDTDVVTIDADDNGKIDTAVVMADSKEDTKSLLENKPKVDSTGTAKDSTGLNKNVMSSLLDYKY